MALVAADVDREKVIKGLAACMPQTEEDAAIGCNGCPYHGHPCGGDYQDNNHVNLPVAMIEDVRALLKAQEPVEPKMMEFVDEGLTWEKYEVPTCAVCGAMLGDALFCPMCGRAVKWE